MPPYCKESHFFEYARSNSSDCATHSIQDQSIVSIIITNNFIGEEVTLDENSVCGYKIIIIIIIILIHYHKRLTCRRIESAYRFIGLAYDGI